MLCFMIGMIGRKKRYPISLLHASTYNDNQSTDKRNCDEIDRSTIFMVIADGMNQQD